LGLPSHSFAAKKGLVACMAQGTPILCRVCGKKLGVVRGFEGRVFTLCRTCEKSKNKSNKKKGANQDPG
jgi:hypothetical protein